MTTRISLALLALLAACASAPRSPERAAAPSRAGTSARAAAEGPEVLSARAQRLFDEAVRAEEEQRKLKVPLDWPYLERKWRAALEAADVPEARYNLGVSLEAQGRLEEARAEYARAREAKPSFRQAAVNLGVLLERQGDPRAAAAIFQDVVRDFPEDAVARARLAELYRAAGQLDDAWRLAREALMRDPHSVAAYHVLVQVALQREQLDLAKLISLRAQKLDAADPELPYFTGRILARGGDEAGAAAQFQKALALRQDFLPARYALLAAAVGKQAWSSVDEHASALLKHLPNDAALHLTRGIALRHLGKTDEALAEYERAERLGGGRLAEVRLARGVLLARVKSECEPALVELRAYEQAAGPVAAQEGSQVVKLQRECERMLEENRKAMEAAAQMQAEAARQAAEKAAKEGRPAPAEGSAAPTPAPGPPR